MAEFTNIPNDGYEIQQLSPLRELDDALIERCDVYADSQRARIRIYLPDFNVGSSSSHTARYEYWNGTQWWGDYTGLSSILAGSVGTGKVDVEFTLRHSVIKPGSLSISIWGRRHSQSMPEWISWRDDIVFGECVNYFPHKRWGKCYRSCGQYGSVLGAGVASGDNVQSVNYWRKRQDMVNPALVGNHFTQIMNVGSSSTAPDLQSSDSDSVPLYTSVTQLWQNAVGGSAPRRRTTMTGYPASGWLYGNIQQGDILGPWLLQDLQAACRQMNVGVKVIEHPGKSKTHEAKAEITDRTPSIPRWWDYEQYGNQWHGKGFNWIDAYFMHDMLDVSGIILSPVEPVTDTENNYICQRAQSRFFHDGYGVMDYERCVSQAEAGKVLVKQISNNVAHSATTYFVPTAPDGIDGATPSYKNLHGELGTVDEDECMWISSDSFYNFDTEREVVWPKEDMNFVIDQTITQGFDIFADVSPAELAAMKWFGYKFSKHITTLAWVWSYS